jgi:hypothetical protein
VPPGDRLKDKIPCVRGTAVSPGPTSRAWCVLFDGGCFEAERYGVHSFRVCQSGSREWAGLVAPQSAGVALINDLE